MLVRRAHGEQQVGVATGRRERLRVGQPEVLEEQKRPAAGRVGRPLAEHVAEAARGGDVDGHVVVAATTLARAASTRMAAASPRAGGTTFTLDLPAEA